MFKCLVAQCVLTDRCNNKSEFVIRIEGNEIRYSLGNSALSNKFDVPKLNRMFKGQSYNAIFEESVSALKYSDTVSDIQVADFNFVQSVQ